MTARAKNVELMKMRVGKAAAAARTARGWSQAYAAQKLDVDSETISRLERGQTIRLDRLLDLANLYQVPLASFFNDAPGPRQSATDEISSMMNILDEANQQWVLQMVRSVIKKMEE